MYSMIPFGRYGNSLDSLFEDDNDSLADLFGDKKESETQPEDEENYDSDGLDSLLDALGDDDDADTDDADVDDDEDNDVDDDEDEEK